MFRAIAWIGLREIRPRAGCYEFKQDFTGASLCGLVGGVAGWGPAICLLRWFSPIPLSIADIGLAVLIIFGTACLAAGVFGFGCYKRITFDQDEGATLVRTRIWWRKSEVLYPYASAALDLHERSRFAGEAGSATDYVLMVRLPDREEIIGAKRRRSEAEKLAAAVAERLRLPYRWSDDTLTSLF